MLAAASVRLVLYPGERKDALATRGHLYVYIDGALLRGYEACAGPPGAPTKATGGHTASETPPGRYTLGRGEQHVTQSWPYSTIPWGAQLRRLAAGGPIEYSTDGKSWHKATGPDGVLTRAGVAYNERTAGHPVGKAVAAELNAAYTAALTPLGRLEPTYVHNDFGPWAFNMEQPAGQRSAFFIHTTPADEAAARAGAKVQLINSHGCVHLRPVDRAEMMQLGYLQRGVAVQVQKYGLLGPTVPLTT